MTDRQKIAEAINNGKLLCDGCPMQGVKEGVFEGDVEVSECCIDCMHGAASGKTDRLIDAIGETKLAYLIS